MSINKVILIGNLGAEPELRSAGERKPYCNLRLATNHSFTDSASERQMRTEWHQVVCFGRTAENCSRYLRKGRQVYVEGRIQSQHWQDKEGIERVSNRVVANVVQFLGPKPPAEPEFAIDAVESPISEIASAVDDLPW